MRFNTVMYHQPRHPAIFIFEIIGVSLHVVSVLKLLNIFLLYTEEVYSMC